MCLSPIRIRNPNAGMSGMASTLMKDTTSAFINVPCGVCSECIANRQMNFVQRIQCEAMVNHLFFVTLTYNNDSLPYIGLSNGRSIRFADISDVQKMFKRLRKRKAFGRDFRFFGVSELGSERGRPHFHLLIFLPKEDGDSLQTCMQFESVLFKEILHEWRRNVAPPVWSPKRKKFVPNSRCPQWQSLCTYVRKFIRGKLRTNYDCHYVNPVLSDGQEADVAFYVLKYMMKPSQRAVRLQQALHMNLDEDEYESVWSLVRPRHFESEAFGLGQALLDENKKYVVHPRVLSYLRNCVQRSKGSFSSPRFFSPITGQSFPLARYYQGFSEIYSIQDALDFYFNDSKGRVDNVIISDDVHVSQLVKKVDDYDKIVRQVDNYSLSSNFDELFDESLDC